MINEIISTSTQTRTFSSSTTVERSNTESRPIGFNPSYLPNSIIKTNATADVIDPPPYPIDFLIHAYEPPPYPMDEIKYDKKFSPYSLGPIGPDGAINLSFPMKIKSLNSSHELAGPSAPTINEQEQKIGLTPYERREIINALVQMNQTVEGKTELERIEFSNAQKKLKELLFAARIKLTKEDKDEFINEVKKIRDIRNSREMENLKEERLECLLNETKRRGDSHAKEEDCHCDIWSILFKAFQLVMVILAYAENKQWKTTQLFIFVCFFTTVSTLCLLIFYFFGRRPPLIVLKCECIYCITCILGFYTATFTQTWKSIKMPLFEIGAMVGYALDIIRIFCLFKKRINFNRKDSTAVPEISKIDNQHSPRRGGSYDSVHHHIVNTTTNNYTNPSRNVFHTNILDETLFNLDFLNDYLYEKNTVDHNDYRHHKSSHYHPNSQYHLNSHLSTNNDDHRNSNHYSTNSDYQLNKDYDAQKQIRLLSNPNAV